MGRRTFRSGCYIAEDIAAWDSMLEMFNVIEDRQILADARGVELLG